MRLLYLLTAFILCGHAVLGQKPKLIAIYFVDTNDKTIGNYCRKDFLLASNRFKYMAEALDHEYREVVDTAKDFNIKTFQSLPNSISSSESDIIVFYISSHGASAGNTNDPYPLIYLGNRDYSSISSLHQQLSKIKHKSLLTIVDACNNYVNLMYDISEQFEYADKNKNFTEEGCVTYNYRKLFEKPFDCIFSASKPGQYSLTGSLGSVFTNIFFAQLDELTMKCRLDKYLTMDNLISKTYEATLVNSSLMCAGYEFKARSGTNSTCKPFEPVWLLSPR